MNAEIRVACSGRCGFVLILVAFAFSSAWAASGRSGEDAIRDLITRYAAAVDAADPEQAAQIWSHAPEVSFIDPLGEEHGLAQIQQNVYTRLMGGMFSERHLEPHDIAVHVCGNAAWAEFVWDFHAKLRKDGSAVTTHGRETQIYRKEKDGWRIVHVHYSAMPERRAE